MLRIVTRKVLSVFAAVALLASFVHAQTLKDIYDFGGSSSDGSYPNSALFMDAEGNLYGTTRNGGNGSGTVFELINSNGNYTERLLYTFNGPDGEWPQASLTMDSAGNLYGTTSDGGAHGLGTVFMLVNSGGSYTERVLYSFAGPDGANPYAAVILDAAGDLYGTTFKGGSGGAGTVFALVNSGGGYTEQVLHSFLGNDGSYPYGGLVMDAAGNLDGVTQQGGSYGVGVVFQLAKGSYTESILHTFQGSGDGANPQGTLILDSTGNLYGTTLAGGAYGYGAVFMLSRGSGYSELHQFAGSDGYYPSAGLLMDSAGNLYGTTGYDYSSGNGTIFELVNSGGVYTGFAGLNLGQFCSSLVHPYAGLIMDSAGNLYGAVAQGGASGKGSIFRFTPAAAPATATTTVLSSSENPANAGDPLGILATVTSAAGYPQGTVTFSSGSTQLGNASLNCGIGSATMDEALILGIGTSTITAQYTPSNSHFAASSGSMSQSVSEPGVVLANGDNTLTGNQTINGSVTVMGSGNQFAGNGGGLTNVTASNLSCVGCIGNQQLGITYAASSSQGGDAANALNLGGAPASSYATLGPNIFTGGQSIFGALSLNSTGTATASKAYNSNPLDLAASVYSSSVARAQSHRFRWMVEPAANSNNTTIPASTLNLLFDSNGTPSETGLSVNANGTINFAPSQSFPIAELTTVQNGSGTVSALGAPNGIATLDSNGQIPASELPATNGTPAILSGWCSGVAPSTAGSEFSFAGLGSAVGSAGVTCSNKTGAATVMGIPVTSAGTLTNLYVAPGALGNAGTHMTFTVYKAAAPGWAWTPNLTTISKLSLTPSTRTVTLTVKSGTNFNVGDQITVSGITQNFNLGTTCALFIPLIYSGNFNGTYVVSAKTSTSVSYADSNIPPNCTNISGATASGAVADNTTPTLSTVSKIAPSATALTCTIGPLSSPSAATCSDTTDTVSVNPGDLISIVGHNARSSGTETIGDIRVSVEKK